MGREEAKWVAHLTGKIKPPVWNGAASLYLNLSQGDDEEYEEEAGHICRHETTKQCSKCLRVLPLTADYFFRAKREKAGFMFECKDCHKSRAKEERSRRYYAKTVLRAGEAKSLAAALGGS